MALPKLPTIEHLNYRYDAHCHVFNKDLISRRIIISMLHEFIEMLELENNEEYKKRDKSKNSEDFFNRLKRIHNFITIGFKEDSIAVYETLDNAYKSLPQTKKFRYTPLMFDLKFCFQELLNDSDEKIFDNSLTKQKEFDNLFLQFEKIKQIINNKLTNLSADKQTLAKTIFTNITNVVANLKSKRETSSYEPFLIANAEHHSFEAQINQLIRLKIKYPENVFPFFVVDPRRKGVLELMKKYVGKGKPFHGVKLYTANGYSPTDPILFGKNIGDDCVYKYCVDNQIPITAHCSSGGFSSFVQQLEIRGDYYLNNQTIHKESEILKFEYNILHDGKKAIDERQTRLNHPLLWKIVLEKYKTLRLNLAHFGGDDGKMSGVRREAILKLISEKENGTYKYPNLYTDLSCIISPTVLNTIYKNIYPSIKDKIMYGSDFYLNMVFIDDIQTYYKQFLSTFSQADFDQISITNPVKFLF